jgi:hypothetical protein
MAHGLKRLMVEQTTLGPHSSTLSGSQYEFDGNRTEEDGMPAEMVELNDTIGSEVVHRLPDTLQHSNKGFVDRNGGDEAAVTSVDTLLCPTGLHPQLTRQQRQYQRKKRRQFNRRHATDTDEGTPNN